MKKNESYLPKRLSPEKVMVLASTIWQNQPSVATDVSTRASNIIQTAYEKRPTFFSGKSEKGILSGLFYHLGSNVGSMKTQQEVALALATTEMTIRASCRDWLKYFPELL
jgi:transcription initiation factor TFIIIB Brf1 subunit/transcription initiation factor TFIIB